MPYLQLESSSLLDVHQAQPESSSAFDVFHTQQESCSIIDLDQPQRESSSILEVDQDQPKPETKMLQDFMDGNRSVDNVVKEVIEETDKLTVKGFLTDVIDFLLGCRQSEGQSRLMNLLVELRESENLAEVDISDSFYDIENELADWFNSLFGRISCDSDLYGQWVEANKLFARFTSANVFDFTHHAVHILDCLLDGPMKERKLYVSPAAQHLIFSSIQLFKFCTITDRLTQWNKWLQAFSSAAKDWTLEESERGLARMAAQIMTSLYSKTPGPKRAVKRIRAGPYSRPSDHQNEVACN